MNHYNSIDYIDLHLNESSLITVSSLFINPHSLPIDNETVISWRLIVIHIFDDDKWLIVEKDCKDVNPGTNHSLTITYILIFKDYF